MTSEGEELVTPEVSTESCIAVTQSSESDKDVKLEDVGIQANDYEIDRPSGKLPARRRLVPYKFRDYRNPDNAENEEDDPDYTVERRTRKPIGRPKKKVIDSNEDINVAEAITLLADKQVLKDKHGSIQQFQKSSDGRTVCPWCGKLFAQKGNLKAHVRMHTGEKPFLCDESGCNNAYRTNESLRRHKLKHIGVKPYECDICHNKFTSSKSLQEHLNRHSDTKPYACSTCGCCFRQASCLRRHVLTHSSELRYTCEVCGRGFSQAVYLRSHMKVHTGERPFRCDVCEKMFKHASDLARHRRIHTGEKPYKCTFCEAAFSDASSRNRHQREHDGSMPYACHFCTERFKRSGKLKSHLKLKHGEKFNLEFKEHGSDYYVFYSASSVDPNNLSGEILSKDGKTTSTDVPNDGSIENGLPVDKNINKEYQEVRIVTTEQLQQITKSASSLDASTEKIEIQIDGNMVENEIPIEIPIECLQGNTDETTVIAITDVPHMDSVKEDNQTPIEYAYQILEQASETQANQVVEVHLDLENLRQNAEKNEQLAVESTKTTVDFVANPDFTSQEYYNWLSSFTELCKMVPMPLDTSLFQKISQVHKTLSDVMAMPSGVIAEKANFKILMNISMELNCIINEHLSYVLENLDRDCTEPS